MKIRRFNIGDESTLFKVFLSAVHEVASADYTQQQIQAWAPEDIPPALWADHIRTLRPFVAELEGEIAGYADVQPNGYIDHFFVASHYARRGVGSQLMLRLHEEAKSLGIDQLTADVSKTAEPFFTRQGFHVVERKSPIRRGVTIPNALMRKPL